MITRALTLLILCVFAFIPLILGEYARNRSIQTTEDYILHGRKLKIFPMYATVFATWMSIFAFMGAISYFYDYGPVYMTTIGWDALFAVLFIFVGKRLWHYGKSNRYMTPTDFFDDIYDSKVLNLLVTSITIVYTMIYLQVQTVGGLLVLRISTGGVISWYIAGIVFFSILVIYMWAGGLRAVALTDMFYGVLIITTLLTSGFFLMKTAGGTEVVFKELIYKDPLNVSMNLEDGGHRVSMWLSLFIVIPIGAFMGPQMWIRNYAASSEKNFNILPFLLYVSSIICVGALFAGSAGIVLAENVTNPEAILIEMMQKYANPFLYIFVIVGIYATIFSTANSQIHALSAVYTIDIHKRYINNKTPDKKLVTIAKWGVLFVSIASYLFIILIPKSIFYLALMALGGISQLFIPLMGALFWKKSTSQAAILGLIAGEVLFLLGVIFNFAEASVCAVIGLFVNAIVFIVISFFGKHRIIVSKKIEIYKSEYERRNH